MQGLGLGLKFQVNSTDCFFAPTTEPCIIQNSILIIYVTSNFSVFLEGVILCKILLLKCCVAVVIINVLTYEKVYGIDEVRFMKKHRCFLICMIMLLCVISIDITGCSKDGKKHTDELKIEEQQKDKDEPEELEIDISDQEEGDSSQTGQDLVTDSAQTRNITLYYVDDRTAEVTGKSVVIQDEYDIWEALQENGILTEDCELLSLQVNETEKKMDLDFNSATGDRIRSMGTTGEIQIIGCIINTYLEAYDCDGIRLTEEGQVLETSHAANFDGYSGKMTF